MVQIEAMSEDRLSKLKTKFWKLVPFQLKKSDKRIIGPNSCTSISVDMQKEQLVRGRSFRCPSDNIFPKRLGKTQMRTSHAAGRPKGHPDRECFRKQRKNNKRKEDEHCIRKRSEDIKIRSNTMQLGKLHEDSNTQSTFNTRGMERPMLSDVHNPNFRIRLYRELNVVRKPTKPTFKSTSPWSQSKPIAMNNEQRFDRHVSLRKGNFFIHKGSTRKSIESSDDEDVFALDI